MERASYGEGSVAPCVVLGDRRLWRQETVETVEFLEDSGGFPVVKGEMGLFSPKQGGPKYVSI